MRDSKPWLLLMLAAGIVITWLYHLYDKSNYSKKTKEIFVTDTTAVEKAVHDSMRNFYSRTLEDLENKQPGLDSSGFLNDTAYSQRIIEINLLRNEIAEILKKNNPTQADFAETNNKITDLRNKIEALKTTYNSSNEAMEASTNDRSGNDKKNQQTSRRITGLLTSSSSQQSKALASFRFSNIRFTITGNSDNKNELETKQSEEAKTIKGSFAVRNNLSDVSGAEVMVIIIDPLGKTINNDAWDIGSFTTSNEGKKIYSLKIKFDYKKGELKFLNFSIEPDVFEKGTYTLLLYQNGTRIGKKTYQLL